MLRKYGVKHILTADEEDFGKVKSTLKENLEVEIIATH
jgi:hypothetical protein